jgi:putative endonuclease
MSDPRHLLGLRAEEAAARWLSGRGWSVIDRRWRGVHGELDLVCRDRDGLLVGVEVKVRTSGRSGSGVESVDRRRVHRLRRALAEYAAGRSPGSDLRLDLVTLSPQGPRWRLRHYRGIDAW